MKNLIVFAIVLSMATPGFATNTRVYKKQKPHVERGTLSSLVLSKEEFKSLSTDDRTIYMLSMIALMQTLEVSQDLVMRKVDTLKTADRKNPWYEMWSVTLMPRAQAWVAVAIEGLIAAGRMAMTVGRPVVMAVPKLMKGTVNYASKAYAKLGERSGYIQAATATAAGEAAEVGVKAATNAAGKTATGAAAKAAADAGAKTTALVKTGEKGAAAAAAEAAVILANKKKELEASIKVFKEAEAAAKKSGLSASELEAAVHARNAAGSQMWSKFRSFMNRGGTSEEFGAMWGNGKVPNPSSWKSMVGWTVGGTAASIGVSKLFEQDGLTPEQAAKMAAAPDSAPPAPVDVPAGADAAGSAAAATAAKKAAVKEAGASCIFGMHPSTFKNMNGEFFCTRPASSSNENCHGDKFQCPANGLVDNEGPIDSRLCIDTYPLDKLTVRCTDKLKSIIGIKKTVFKEDQDYENFAKGLKNYLLYIEAKDGMKNERNETKSIAEYCSTENEIQHLECEAISGVVAALNESGSGKVIEKRAVAAAETPPAEQGTPTSAPPPAGAAPAKTKSAK